MTKVCFSLGSDSRSLRTVDSQADSRSRKVPAQGRSGSVSFSGAVKFIGPEAERSLRASQQFSFQNDPEKPIPKEPICEYAASPSGSSICLLLLYVEPKASVKNLHLLAPSFLAVVECTKQANALILF